MGCYVCGCSLLFILCDLICTPANLTGQQHYLDQVVLELHNFEGGEIETACISWYHSGRILREEFGCDQIKRKSEYEFPT